MQEGENIFPGIWTFEIVTITYGSNEESSFYHIKYSGDDSVLSVTVPPCVYTPEDDPPEEPQEDPPEEPQEDPEPEESIMDDLQCTLDTFGYGEIKVTDKWGSFTKISDEEGYEIHWGWSFEYADPDSPYSIAGIQVNFNALGPYPYEQAYWGYTDDIGKLDSIWWTSNPGTYTFEIVDFENLGSYCADDDTITVEVG